MIVYTALLFYGVLTLWVPERWAWSLFQAGVSALAGWRGVRPSRELLPLAAVAVWPLLQLALASTASPAATLDAALDWFTFLVVFALGCEILATRQAREKFLRAVTVFGAGLATVAIAQQYTAHGKIFWLFPSGFTDDVLGPFVNRNQYAAWVELLLPVALVRRNWIAAAALFSSVAVSASRAGFALAAIETVVILSIVFRRRVAIIPVAVAALAIGWLSLHSRFGEPESVRIDAARASLQMIRDHPWTGYGLGAWSTIYSRYATFDAGAFVNQAHNDWLQWASEGGIPFVLLLAALAVLLWRRAVPSVYGLGTVAFLLHALVDYPMQQRPALAAWFFAMAAAAWCYRASRPSPERIPDLFRDNRPAARDCPAVEDRPRVLLE